jgi:uncharacterized protein (TIGR04255 family)
MSLDLPKADPRIAERPTPAMVVCQIQFDEQESIAAAAAIAFRELLGGESGAYSKLEPVAGGRIMLEVGPGGPVTQMSQKTGWNLETKDSAWSLTLLPDSMGLQANEGRGAYSGWDDFRGRLAEALGALDEVASPAIERRLGLRFVDRIPGASVGVENARGWSEYISPTFLGPVAEPTFADAAKFAQQQLILDVGDGSTCNLRQGLAAVLSPAEPNTEYVIDTDIYQERGRAFDTATILDSVDAFAQTIDGLFGTITTPALLDKTSP